MPKESHEDAAKKIRDARLTWSSSGFELDFTPSLCVGDDIKTHFSEAGVRGDGAKMDKDDAGKIDARETSHWDITFLC